MALSSRRAHASRWALVLALTALACVTAPRPASAQAGPAGPPIDTPPLSQPPNLRAANGTAAASLADAIAAAAAGSPAAPLPQAAGDTPAEATSSPGDGGADPAAPADQGARPGRAAAPPAAVNGPDDEVIIIGDPNDATGSTAPEVVDGVGPAALGPPTTTTRPPGAALKDAAEAATFEAHTGKSAETVPPADPAIVAPLAAPANTRPRPVSPQYVREDGTLVRRRAVGVGVGVVLGAALLALIGGVAFAVHKRKAGFGRMAEVQMQAAPGSGGALPAGGA